MKMAAVLSSETPFTIFQTTRRHIINDRNLHGQKRLSKETDKAIDRIIKDNDYFQMKITGV
jgi:hypothetical protein